MWHVRKHECKPIWSCCGKHQICSNFKLIFLYVWCIYSTSGESTEVFFTSCRKLLLWKCVTESCSDSSVWAYTCNEFSSYRQTVLFQVQAAIAWWLYLHKGSQFSGLLSTQCLAHTHSRLPKPTNTKWQQLEKVRQGNKSNNKYKGTAKTHMCAQWSLKEDFHIK
jgi:hypothetical protein